MCIFHVFYLYSPDNKSRSNKRSKAAEAHDHADSSGGQCYGTIDPAPGTSRSTRLTELLSRSGCSQPPGLKPRPPSTPRVREQPCPNSRTLSPGSFAANQTDSHSRDRIPAKKKEIPMIAQAPPGRTEDPLSSQKHQNQKKHPSKGQAGSPLVRSCSSLEHRGVKKPQCAPTNLPCKKETLMRNEAARIIQRAWRR